MNSDNMQIIFSEYSDIWKNKNISLLLKTACTYDEIPFSADSSEDFVNYNVNNCKMPNLHSYAGVVGDTQVFRVQY